MQSTPLSYINVLSQKKESRFCIHVYPAVVINRMSLIASPISGRCRWTMQFRNVRVFIDDGVDSTQGGRWLYATQKYHQ